MKCKAVLVTFALLFVMATAMVATNVSAEETDLDLSLVTGQSNKGIKTGESYTFNFVLENTGSVAQTVTIYAETATYWGDPGFGRDVLIDGVSMGAYFQLDLDPSEVVNLDLYIWAYACDTQMPFYYVELNADSDLDHEMVRVDVQRAGQ